MTVAVYELFSLLGVVWILWLLLYYAFYINPPKKNMETSDRVRKLAKAFIDDHYNGDLDFLDQAEEVIEWLLKYHNIIPKNE